MYVSPPTGLASEVCLQNIPSRRQEVVRPSPLPFKAPYALAFLYLLAFLPGVTSLFSFFSQNAALHAGPLHS